MAGPVHFPVCMWLVVMATAVGVIASSRQHGRACSEPSNLQSMADSLNTPSQLLHETFFQIPQLRDSLLQGAPLPGDSQPKRSIFSGTPRDCAQRHWNETDKDMCPSYYVINMDARRIPSMLLESRCLCREGDSGQIRESAPRCLMPPGEVLRGARDARFKCEPVHYHTWVLRRGDDCSDGVYQYQRVLEPLQVGCQCHQHLLNF